MAAATQTVPELITMEEYLHTAYHPDCDFVDGRLEERTMGTPKHGLLQMQLGHWFIAHQAEWRVRVMSEVRTRVSKTRVRLPDVCVVPMEGASVGEVRVTPPMLAIEILSPEDRMNRVIERLDDFLAMGVEHLWVFDPEERTAYTYTASGLKLVKTAELRVAESPIYVNLAELFSALD
jgi:Uma2 family endonuclease